MESMSTDHKRARSFDCACVWWRFPLPCQRSRHINKAGKADRVCVSYVSTSCHIQLPSFITFLNYDIKAVNMFWPIRWVLEGRSMHGIDVNCVSTTDTRVHNSRLLVPVSVGGRSHIFWTHLPYLFYGQVSISSHLHVVWTFPEMSVARACCRRWLDCSLAMCS